MATDQSDLVKQGYLRCRSGSLGLWQKRWIVLRSNVRGPCRLEKYAGEREARNAQRPKVQLLINVSTVTRLPMRKHAFTIDFHDGSSRSFACDSELEADNWVKITAQECFMPSSGISSGEPDVLKPGIQKELQEQFRVYFMPSKLDVFGECLLQVTHENIYLWDMHNAKVKLWPSWPLTALRRYGSDLTKFTFEAGRHCVTGEGMFIFHTLEGEKIYRKVHQATLAIAEAHQKMKKQTIPSPIPREDSFKRSSAYKATTAQTAFEVPFEAPVQSEPMAEQAGSRNSWYHSDNESDLTASASEVYSHGHGESQFAMEHRFQAN